MSKYIFNETLVKGPKFECWVFDSVKDYLVLFLRVTEKNR